MYRVELPVVDQSKPTLIVLSFFRIHGDAAVAFRINIEGNPKAAAEAPTTEPLIKVLRLLSTGFSLITLSPYQEHCVTLVMLEIWSHKCI